MEVIAEAALRAAVDQERDGILLPRLEVRRLHDEAVHGLALGAGEQTTRSKGWSELRRYLAADLPPGADPQAVTDVHRWGFAYFDGPLEAMEAKAIQAEDAERLHRALRHA